MTIIRENLAHNSFGRGPGAQYLNASGMPHEAVYLFVFIGLSNAG
jgi:hypothetical protein